MEVNKKVRSKKIGWKQIKKLEVKKRLEVNKVRCKKKMLEVNKKVRSKNKLEVKKKLEKLVKQY